MHYLFLNDTQQLSFVIQAIFLLSLSVSLLVIAHVVLHSEQDGSIVNSGLVKQVYGREPAGTSR